jgi:hypothetical protein
MSARGCIQPCQNRSLICVCDSREPGAEGAAVDVGERERVANQGCCYCGRLQVHQGHWEVELACGCWASVVVKGSMWLSALAVRLAHQEGIGQVESSIVHVMPRGTSP